MLFMYMYISSIWRNKSWNFPDSYRGPGRSGNAWPTLRTWD